MLSVISPLCCSGSALVSEHSQCRKKNQSVSMVKPGEKIRRERKKKKKTLIHQN